ncbi:Fructosamine kinase [Paraliobacillus sp. PM-2]|uniref:fructosamine kinase family protein n=1 Tax=Paraliobacillus sp. PM-2 TaxID=1462524 RepID=UPI00061C011D|nr:fructosamine kinase family protein [Paraliobacillus sp. PM-2]CQR46118.1 Fructosamine kinase [Paraliobacillus sp. PM-2]
MKQQLKYALKQMGDDSLIQTITPVTGGDINQAYHVQTNQHNYFVKQNDGVPSHFFYFEAKGLSLIEQTNTIAVPHVYYYNEPIGSEQAIIIMDWIEGDVNSETTATLGYHLANMHQDTSNYFGLDQHGFIGLIDQPNQFTSNWVTYLQQYRLIPLLERATKHNLLPKYRREKLEKLIDNLTNWLPHSPKASLLHGDLWGGNWLVGPNGNPYLIDPAVFYGDHLFELAFTELFGGFPQTFYDAYQEVFPIEPYYEDVKQIYQLYYLLVHLILFGEGYGAAVDRVLAYYIH